MQKARSHPHDSRSRHESSHRLWAHGFRFYFTRLPAFFSPFPHGTRTLSVAGEYLALEGGPPRFSQSSSNPPAYSGTGVTRRMHVRLQGSHLLWRNVPVRFDSMHTHRAGQCPTPALQPRTLERVRFGLFRVRSPLLAESRFDFSSSRYLDVSVPWVGSSFEVTGFDSCRV